MEDLSEVQKTAADGGETNAGGFGEDEKWRCIWWMNGNYLFIETEMILQVNENFHKLYFHQTKASFHAMTCPAIPSSEQKWRDGGLTNSDESDFNISI